MNDSTHESRKLSFTRDIEPVMISETILDDLSTQEYIDMIWDEITNLYNVLKTEAHKKVYQYGKKRLLPDDVLDFRYLISMICETKKHLIFRGLGYLCTNAGYDVMGIKYTDITDMFMSLKYWAQAKILSGLFSIPCCNQNGIPTVYKKSFIMIKKNRATERMVHEELNDEFDSINYMSLSIPPLDEENHDYQFFSCRRYSDYLGGRVYSNVLFNVTTNAFVYNDMRRNEINTGFQFNCFKRTAWMNLSKEESSLTRAIVFFDEDDKRRLAIGEFEDNNMIYSVLDDKVNDLSNGLIEYSDGTFSYGKWTINGEKRELQSGVRFMGRKVIICAGMSEIYSIEHSGREEGNVELAEKAIGSSIIRCGDGAVYIGIATKDPFAKGKGIIVFRNGDYTIGSWGWESQYFEDLAVMRKGDNVYIGHIAESEIVGFGVAVSQYTLEDDSHIMMEYQIGEMNGYSCDGFGVIYRIHNGNKSIMAGQFKEGKRNGYAISYYGDKSYCLGEYKNELLNGYAISVRGNSTFYDENLILMDYCGFKGREGDKYEGEFKDGYAEGYGRLTMVDGNVYEGYFSRGAFSGIGELKVKNSSGGLSIKGNWIDGKPEGEFDAVFSDGRKEKVIYSEGKKMGDGQLYKQIQIDQPKKESNMSINESVVKAVKTDMQDLIKELTTR